MHVKLEFEFNERSDVYGEAFGIDCKRGHAIAEYVESLIDKHNDVLLVMRDIFESDLSDAEKVFAVCYVQYLRGYEHKNAMLCGVICCD